MDVDFFVLESSQQLVGERGVESVLAAVGVMALMVDGRLVREISRVCHHIRSRRLGASRDELRRY